MAVLLVNQHTVPIFIDIVNAFAETGQETILFTGHIEKGGKPLSGKVKVVHSARYRRASSLSRMFSWLMFTIHYFFYLLFSRKPSRILVVTNPPLAPFVTAIISSYRKIAYHVLIYDLYPEALVQAGLLNARHFIYRLWERSNSHVFTKANKIFTLSESMKEAVSVYAPSSKVHIIHNWADTSYIHPLPRSHNKFLKKHNLHNKMVVMYSGNMGLTHDLESVVAAAELLKSYNEFVFVFIGDGGKRLLLKQRVDERKINNVLFLPYQSATDFPMAMAAADIGVVTLGIGAEGISVPSKTYINLAAGVCLLAIAPVTSELSRLIREHDAGVICAPGSPEQVAAFLKQLLQDPTILDTYRRNALKAASNYTPENAKDYTRLIMEN